MKDKILEYINSKQIQFLNKTQLMASLSEELPDVSDDIIDEMVAAGDLVIDETGKIATSTFKGYIKCSFVGNRKGFGFCQVVGDGQDVFVANHNINTAIDGDKVLLKVINRPEGMNPEGKVMKILARDNKNVVGLLERSSTHALVKPDNDRFFKDIIIPKKWVSTANDGEKVVVEVMEYGHKIFGKIVEVLGKANDKHAEQLSIVRKHGLKMDFDVETMLEAKKIRSTVVEKDWAGRRDLRKLRTITIDGSDTRDVDDAISIEVLRKNEYRIGVHIADVAQYVVQDTALDKEAFVRATSVYFPDQVIPMLPKELSNGICSLNEGVDRLALSVFIDVDQHAKVLRSEVFESVINVSAHLIYDDVSAALLGDPVQAEKLKDYLPDFRLYESLTLELEKYRKSRGAIELDMAEAYIEVDSEGDIVNIHKRQRTISHRMIESLMILANEQVAEKYFAKKTPFVYRVHEKPDPTRLDSFVKFAESQGVKCMVNPEDCTSADLQKVLDGITDPLKKDVVSRVLLRSMMKAKYAPECVGHYGLASTFYCHFTSPIRRYPDLAIHRIIKRELAGKVNSATKPYIQDFVEKASAQSSMMEKLADDCSREVDDYKKCLFMKSFIGQSFAGFVSTVTSFGLFVELENTVDGLVHITALPQDTYVFDESRKILVGGTHMYKMGDKLTVVLADVNEKQRKIDFTIEGVTPMPRVALDINMTVDKKKINANNNKNFKPTPYNKKKKR